ncbi:hypothetical protein ABK040_009339 [Willaertia magna]
MSFDLLKFKQAFQKYVQRHGITEHQREVETATVIDLLKEVDSSAYSHLTVKQVQNEIDADNYGWVSYASLEYFAKFHFENSFNKTVKEGIELFYNQFSSDKGLKVDDHSDRYIPLDDMIKLLRSLHPSLSHDEANEMCSTLNQKEGMVSVKHFMEKILNPFK